MQHHGRQRPPLALPAVGAFAWSLRNNARPLQMQLQPGVAPAETMVLDEMLVERLDREALVTLAIKPLHLFGPVNRNPLARGLAEPAVDEPGLALLLIAPRPAPERPLAHPEQLRRLLLIELPRFQAVKKSQKPRHAHSLFGFPPTHPNPPKKGSDYRTGRALPKPDISSATDNLRPSACGRAGRPYRPRPRG